jgi:SAM-dependent methyltransferase
MLNQEMLYQESQLPQWIEIGKRQQAKDEQFIDMITQYLNTGTILELGGSCGQLSEILTNSGFNVTASDYAPFFVEYMKSRGLSALVVDAMNIQSSLNNEFDNVFCQGASPLVNTDLSLTRKTYDSIYKSLRKGGRFIAVMATGYPERILKSAHKFNVINDHFQISQEFNFKIVTHFRHQILPSQYYAKFNKSFLNLLELSLGKHLGIRHILVLEK